MDDNTVSLELLRRMRARRGLPPITDTQIKQQIVGWGLYMRWQKTGIRPDGSRDPLFVPTPPPARRR